MSDPVAIAEPNRVALASLIARRGRAAELRASMRSARGAELPSMPHIAEGEGVRFIWDGPDRWLVASASLSPAGLVAALRAGAGGLAAVCDQSDGHVLLRVSGRGARDALAKGLPIDLHPSVFSTGSAAITVAAHIGCRIWQTDDVPTYEIAVPRSLAASFRHWLDGAAAGGEP